MPYNDFGEWTDEDPNAAGNTGVLTRPSDYTHDPSGGNWGLGDNDWIDRYPGDEQDVIRQNWYQNRGAAATSTTTTTPAAGANAHLVQLWNDNGQDPQRFYRALIAKNNWTGKQSDPSTVKRIVDAFNVVWPGHVAQDARTDGLSKGFTVDGQFVKVLDGSDNWIWDNGSTAPGPQPNNLGDLTKTGLLDPYEGQPPPGWVPPDGSEIPGPFNYADFKAPTAEDVFNEPGYQFRSNEGMRGIEQAASAQGLLRSRGTLKDLAAWNQNFAQGAYGDVLNRDLGIYNTNRGNQRDIYTLDFDRRNQLRTRAWDEYKTGHDMFTGWQDSVYNKLYGTTGAGLSANA